MSTDADGEVALAVGSVRYRRTPPRARPTGGTVMLLAGLGASARESAMFEPLVQALTLAGHQVVAVDWEGPAAQRTVASEVEALLAAEALLIESGAVDAGRVVLFGHSVGALVVALAASVVSVAGVVVYGAAARRFADALESGAARQLPLRGFARAAASAEAEAAGELYRAVLREDRSRWFIEAHSPRALACVAAADLTDDTLFGSPLSYLRSVDAIEPAVAWRRVACPVRAIQGAFDWVVGERDAQHIAGWSRAGEVTLVPSADHYFGEHPDLESSMRNRGRGVPSSGAARAVVASCDILLNHAVLAGA